MLNINKNKYINIELKFAKNWFQKGIGLMFLNPKKFDFGLVFELRKQKKYSNSIHMLFVFMPILAIFLDNNKKIVDKKILKPFNLRYTPKKSCTYLIELPITHKNNFKINDKLNW